MKIHFGIFALLFLVAHPWQALGDEDEGNYVTNAHSTFWKGDANGDRRANPDDPSREVLTLQSDDPFVQPRWVLLDLEFEPDQSYRVDVKIKAGTGVRYGIYLENAGPPDWQNRSFPYQLGDGSVQVNRHTFSFPASESKSYLVIQQMGPGFLQIEEVRIAKDEDKSQKIAELLKAKQGADLLLPGDEDVWTFTADQGGQGRLVKVDRPEKVGLLIKNDGEGNPAWVRSQLAIDSDQPYLCSYSVRAGLDQKYRLYIENNSDGRWQSVGDTFTGTGDWADHEMPFQFAEITAKSHIVLQILSPGEVIFSGIRISQ